MWLQCLSMNINKINMFPLGHVLILITFSRFECQSFYSIIQVFKSKRAQSSHMKAHTKALEPVKCEKCGKEFRHPSALKFHM